MSDIHKLTGAYALDAVDDLERAAFERHLAECADCRTEVASLRETAALLAESTAVTPPSSLRDSVLSGIAAGPPASPGRRTSPACCLVSASGRRVHRRRPRHRRCRLAAVVPVGRQPVADGGRAGAAGTRRRSRCSWTSVRRAAPP